MDSGACTQRCHKCKDSSLKPLEKLDDISAPEANKDVPGPPEVSDGTCSLGPITPDAEREHGDFAINFQSPLTVVRKPPELACASSNCNCNNNGREFVFLNNGIPQTPKEGVFDPFAPGPEDMLRAPRCEKYLDELRSNVARRLSFDTTISVVEPENPGDDAESLSDQEMFESVYENLLEAIVLMQTEGFLAEISNIQYDAVDCKTPPLAPRLNGTTDTCPDAPLKPASKSRNIYLGLCRKLEF
ncbi:PR domain zinc finger protein 8, putative isoform 1 [Quillaja saponaria]|uniref:PR domain zinc finger protein 8, putative isoform 1 n=1 Tax=Quillaja saponaria TaxID=32244 RepID=A0AAD7LMT4_QUISA|nr:PR domain zinc finger protein 8, putative isoform 1 [Quillaja saponaria]KAJ7961026.1 PR domain zinc finger protein 8, putative isoform 1 [Quillaja saponaria]